MIYLASPYSHEKAWVREFRYKKTYEFTRYCTMKGELIFSPVVYGHQFVEKDKAVISYSFWQPFNEHMILACSEMRVLCLMGWKESKGVRAELAFAEAHGMPITFAEPLNENI
jgi:hypothetical protein